MKSLSSKRIFLLELYITETTDIDLQRFMLEKTNKYGNNKTSKLKGNRKETTKVSPMSKDYKPDTIYGFSIGSPRVKSCPRKNFIPTFSKTCLIYVVFTMPSLIRIHCLSCDCQISIKNNFVKTDKICPLTPVVKIFWISLFFLYHR